MKSARITDNCIVPIRMDSFICSTILHRRGFSRLVIRATRFAISGAPKKKNIRFGFCYRHGFVSPIGAGTASVVCRTVGPNIASQYLLI